MDEKTNHQAPRRGSWGRRIGIVLGVLILLLVVVYFVGTSSAFIKSVVLPKVGSAINAKVTADDISLSPFSSADIRGLRVQTTGPDPLLTAAQVRVRYSLMDIIRGNIQVDEITLNTPVIHIVQEADGTSNLDPILKRESKPSESKSKEPTRLSLRNISLQNGTVQRIVKSKDGGADRLELRGLTITLDRLGNGQSGKLTLASDVRMEQKHGNTNNVLAAKVNGGYDIALNQGLMPDTVKGSTKLEVTQGEGSFKEISGFNATLNADLTPKELREVALRFARGDQALGQVRMSGPIDTDKKEGNLKIEILSLDKNVLALAAAGKNYDFANSLINSTNQVTISQGGTFFAANGNLAGRNISVKQQQMATPEMNLNLEYQVNVNTADKTALIERLNLTGETGGKTFLTTELDRQMNLSWGETVKGYKDAALRLILTNFNLAEWKAVIGTNASAGILNATLALVAQQDGKLLNTEIAANVRDLNAQFGTNRLENAAATFQSSGTIEKMNIVNLPRFAFTLQQNNTPVLQGNGAARYVLDTKETSAQLSAEGVLARLLALAPQPDAKVQNGVLKLSAKYSDGGGKKAAVGNLLVSDFTGAYQTYAFTNFTINADYNVAIQNQDVSINQAALTFKQGVKPGGSVDLKGQYNLEKKSGQISFQTLDLNENTFGAVLAPSLGANQLVSISMNASGEAKLDPAAETAIKAQVKLTNWVVRDAAGKLPGAPLSVEVNVDGGMRQQTLDLRQLLVQLTPTPRAKNALQLQAKLDLSKTNPAPGTITLSSESFDVTPYYDLFAGGKTHTTASNKPEAAPAPAAPAPAGGTEEPKPITLPFQQLTANLKFDRFYLRDMAISNWTGTIAIRSNTVAINPFKLQLNGGAVDLTGNVNVGVPGYQYDLAFKADAVPLAPLANSFGSGQSNQLQGNFLANAQIRGAGVTGPSLRKNLAGNVALNLTNLNYQVVGPKMQRILVPISLALRVPELTQTLINWVSADTTIGNGTVSLRHLGVESEAFYAESQGTITLADVLTNSTLNLPIDLSLRYALAQKAGLLSSDTPANAKFAKIPRFVTVKGTVGAPDPDINKLAIAGMLARGAAALGIGDAKTEKALGTIGNLLTGQKGTNTSGTNSTSATANILQGVTGLLGGGQNTNTAGTNATATNASPAGALLKGLGGLLNTPPPTNNAATNAAAPTNTPAQNLFDSLLGGRKKKQGGQ